jgi:WhiB family redox-sensing transcriptional regulator
MSAFSLPVPPAWMAEAVCASVDPETFFPDKGPVPVQVKAICNACPVSSECLEFAITNGEQWGIWGGVTVRPRRAIKGAAA